MNIENLPDGAIPTFIITAIVLSTSILPILIFFKEILTDFEVSRFKRVMNTKNYEDSLSESLKISLLDERDKAVFYRIYGLDLEKKHRDIALKVIEKSNNDIYFKDIRRADDYISFKNNRMIIKYRPWLNILKEYKRRSALFFYLIAVTASFIVLSFYIDIPYLSYFSKNLLTFNVLYYVFIAISYFFIAYNQLKKEASLKSVIRILSQADQLPQYIKVDEDWWFNKGDEDSWFKKTLRKIGYQPKSFAECDFNEWE